MQQDHVPTSVPNMTMCDSKMIHSYGYDKDTAALFVRFIHGRKLYRYDNFPDDLYQAMREAISVGKFFNQRIAKIQALIAEIREYAVTDNTAATIAVNMDQLESFPIDERFGEFSPDAEQVKVATMNRLVALHSAAVKREAAERAEAERLAAEQARIKAEREELEKQKAEQQEWERLSIAKAAQEAKDRARIEAEAKAARNAEEQASKARIEAQERAAAELRAKADAEAMALRIAEEQRLRSIREAEEKRLRAEADRLAKERLAAEERERKKQEAIEAKVRAKREKEEAAERARRLKEQERMDARQMLEAFVTRYGSLPEFAGVVEAIEACLAKAAT